MYLQSCHLLQNSNIPASPAHVLQATVLHIILDNFKSAIKTSSNLEWQRLLLPQRALLFSPSERKSENALTFSIQIS